MQVVSPFGKYSQIVAVVVALAIILAHIGSLVISNESQLDEAFWIALGAVFGSFATVNGLKAPVVAAHTRLDALGAPPAEEAARIVSHESGTSGPYTPTRPGE